MLQAIDISKVLTDLRAQLLDAQSRPDSFLCLVIRQWRFLAEERDLAWVMQVGHSAAENTRRWMAAAVEAAESTFRALARGVEEPGEHSLADSIAAIDGVVALHRDLRIRAMENRLIYAKIQMVCTERKHIERTPSTGGACYPGIVLEGVAEGVARRFGRFPDLRIDPVGAVPIKMSAANFGKAVEETVDNAFRYSEKGDEVAVFSFAAGGWFCVNIRDEGRGFDLEGIRGVMDNGDCRIEVWERDGKGLGLAIARTLVEMNHGQFSIAGKPGKGTWVTIAVPSVASPFGGGPQLEAAELAAIEGKERQPGQQRAV